MLISGESCVPGDGCPHGHGAGSGRQGDLLVLGLVRLEAAARLLQGLHLEAAVHRDAGLGSRAAPHASHGHGYCRIEEIYIKESKKHDKTFK